jgi:hypothetical protein
VEQQTKNSAGTFNEVERVLRTHFENPDIEAAKVIFACVAAHRIEDHPPAWLLAIAPPGSMKTVILESLISLPSVHFPDEVTDKTFISGKMDPLGSKRKTPASYLHRIGKEGILVSADFGTILSMDRRIRNVVFAQLRRIYDGRFSREFGTDENIDERSWEGRLTFLAGATPEVDKYHSVFQSLGERFVRVRWPRAGGIDAGLRALRQKDELKAELQIAVHEFLLLVLSQGPIEAPAIGSDWERRIATFSEIVALARADVPRTRDDREICGIAQPEGNTRLAQELAQVGRGWAILNGRTEVSEDDFSLIVRAGLDSIPPARKLVLLALVDGKSPYSLGLPESTVYRALEDLQAIGLTAKHESTWRLSETAKEITVARFPQCVCG